MFDPQDDPALSGKVSSKWKKKHDPLESLASTVTTLAQPGRNSLDGEKMRREWSRLLGVYSHELERQSVNRMQQHIDTLFYDGDQWDEDEKQTLLDRGQTPIVFNMILTTVNWMLGTEKRGRTDYKILPRHKEGSKAAEKKSQLLKYLSDVNRSAFAESDAFADCIKVGVGWMESGVQDDDEGEPIYERHESWRNMLWDSLCNDRDLESGRFIARTKWADADILAQMFPDRKHIIDLSTRNAGDRLLSSLDGTGDEVMDSVEDAYESAHYATVDAAEDYRRDRVRCIEMWYRTPAQDDYIAGGQFSGELADRSSPGHQTELMTGRARIVPKTKMRTHVAIFTDAGLLYIGKSPYRHNRYPFTPVWCYRRDADNMPYGMIRQLRDPQTEINKRRAKALHILGSNKVIVEDGAVEDMDQFIDELADDNGVLVVQPGKKIELQVGKELAPSHLAMGQEAGAFIQTASGVTDENMGRTTNATSGKAIIARQDQGSLATATIFDNLRYARQARGEKLLSLVEQFMDQPKQFRITNMRGNPDYITVNGGPEDDIVSTKADFIIGEEDFNTTMRQAQVAELFEMMTQLAPASPQIVMSVLDLLVEAMDIPQREEIVKRVRQLTGMEDPDADPNNPDPETQARNQQKAQQADMQQRAAMAELQEKEASAAEKMARAEKAGAESQKIMAEIARILAETTGANTDTQVKALQAASTLMQTMGAAAGPADAILDAAGFVPANQPPMPAPAPAPAPMPDQAAPPTPPEAMPGPAPAPMDQQQQPTPQTEQPL